MSEQHSRVAVLRYHPLPLLLLQGRVAAVLFTHSVLLENLPDTASRLRCSCIITTKRWKHLVRDMSLFRLPNKLRQSSTKYYS